MTSVLNDGVLAAGSPSMPQRLEHRNVDRQDPLPSEVRQPAQALEAQLDLPHARRERHAQRRARGRAEHAVLVEAVPCLKTPHRIDDGPVVDVLQRNPPRGRQIAERGEVAGSAPAIPHTRSPGWTVVAGRREGLQIGIGGQDAVSGQRRPQLPIDRHRRRQLRGHRRHAVRGDGAREAGEEILGRARRHAESDGGRIDASEVQVPEIVQGVGGQARIERGAIGGPGVTARVRARRPRRARRRRSRDGSRPSAGAPLNMASASRASGVGRPEASTHTVHTAAARPGG